MRDVIVADGGALGPRQDAGRQWHRDTAYRGGRPRLCGVERADERWMGSHLELRGRRRTATRLRWLFHLGNQGKR